MTITFPITITARPFSGENLPASFPVEIGTAATASLQKGGRGWLAYLEGEICGVLAVEPTSAAEAEITMLYILPAFRGVGAAYVLLEAAAENDLTVWVSIRQEREIRFFTRFGFVYTGESRTAGETPQVRYICCKTELDQCRLDVPWIDQREMFPTGCESVSTVMALRYAGVDLSPKEWIERHLPIGQAPHDEKGIYTGANPWKVFPGDPCSPDGWGCFVPVIEKAAETALCGTGYRIKPLYSLSLELLCRLFVARGIPVILWATLDMAEGRQCRPWQMDDGSGSYTWTEPMHCLLMTGYDDTYIYCNDPMRAKDTAYPWDAVRLAYTTMHRQAAVVLPERLTMEYAHSAGAILYTRRGDEIRYLLVKESLGHIGYPKGHLEAGETVADAAVREILEETGLHADLHTDFRRETLYLLRNGNKWKWVTYFTAFYDVDAVPQHTGEVADFMELSYPEAMETLTYQNTKELLAEADRWIRANG